jgi:hypothetical protein
MQEGFDEAIELQKATFRQLKEMIDRREIGKAGKIKYARSYTYGFTLLALYG